ncbi:PQQ-dependent sugar dehydrogenase, partial [Flagellimonas sp. DF-77]|uniref:PQQ-dependent sugar dehydrogenase n=1 Tax=Flagellimonas algarum TaxID=3230298 RepID=UPI003392F32A
QLPNGADDYQRVDVVTGLSNSTTFKFLPDGRMLILDRNGELVVYRPDTQTKVSAGTISVFSDLEDGLIGVAVDPDFTSNNYIYLHYSPSGFVGNRVSRFTMVGDVLDMGSEAVLLQWPTQRNNYFHAAGDMDFDSAGNLYIATGDNSNHSDYGLFNESDPDQSAENTASNTNDLRGKILRITPDVGGGPVEHPNYTIPTGNLFTPGTPGTRDEIYVMGARNPYRIFVDKNATDWLFWGEVGPDANQDGPSGEGPLGMDEMNLVKQPGNYGWPYFAGNGVNDPDTQGAGDDSALYAYQVPYGTPPYYNDPASPQNTSVHNTGLTSLPAAQPAWIDFFHRAYMAGPRYHYDPDGTDPQRLPQEFDGRFFYFNFVNSHVWAVAMDGDGNITNNEQMTLQIFPFSGDTDFIDMQLGPDDHLYILEYRAGSGGKVIRLDYTGEVTNRSPIVSLSADPTNGALPLTVNFSSAGTSDPDGDSPLSYEWDFETDGTVDSTAENPTHVYTVAGNYNVQLRVSDGNGGEGVANLTINAGNTLADFTFRSPLEGGFFDWSDDISLDILVSDAEDGDTDGNPGTVGSGIDCNDVDVLPELGHSNHSHADLTISGCAQELNLDPQGHNISGDADLFFVIGVDYTDQGGLTSDRKIEIYPKRNEAEFRDGESGTEIISNTDIWGGGSEAVRVDAGGYIYFEGRNLTNITSVRYRVSSSAAGGSIEFRTGSPTGPVLTTTAVPDTGGSDDWVDVESAISDPGGMNDLYFVFTGSGTDIFDLNYVEFVGPGVSVDNSAPTVNDVMAVGPTEVWAEFSEYVDAVSAVATGNYAIDNGITVVSASLQPDGRTVSLTTSALSAGQNYELTISGVENLAGLSVATGSYGFTIEDPVRINSGGGQVIAGGQIFAADQYATGGNTFTDGDLEISGTSDDELYRSERWGEFTYEIPVPASGNFDIRLHFAEIFFGQPGAGSGGGEGSRVFDVSIEGNVVLDDFDILSEVATATALVKELNNINITDGFATIQFLAEVGNPKITAIELLPNGDVVASPNISITNPTNGSDVNDPFDVAFQIENWEIAVGGTHMHYYVDGVMVGPHYSYDPITISGLSLGQ